MTHNLRIVYLININIMSTPTSTTEKNKKILNWILLAAGLALNCLLYLIYNNVGWWIEFAKWLTFVIITVLIAALSSLFFLGEKYTRAKSLFYTSALGVGLSGVFYFAFHKKIFEFIENATADIFNVILVLVSILLIYLRIEFKKR
jgi:hypothetical protein